MNNFYLRWAFSTWFGWLHQNDFCPHWDAALNRLIDKHWADMVLDSYEATFGEVKVWIANPFYSYGTPRLSGRQPRPSVKTMKRLDSLVWHKQKKINTAARSEYTKKMESL